jgi:HD-like signal output (HDOD) protein
LVSFDADELHETWPISVLTRVKVEIDEELWYGVSSDEAAEAEAAKSMAARMGRIVGAKPFPAAAQRLSQITQNPNCLMDEVVSVLESDQALCARLLRLVNSVGFSLRTPCTSVRHAAALVGTEKLNQVASTAAILDMYESGSKQAADLLEHATVVGALCRYLAFHFGLPPDELFTCGFLHDIGKLMLLETEGDDYLALLGEETPEFDTLFVEERKRFGFDHALLAGHVLAAWNIPHPVPKVVAWHHHVTRAYAESTEMSQMVSTLRLADAMSFALQREDTQVQIEALARMEAASYMDISEGQLAAMWDEVRALTERARAVFRGEPQEETARVHTSRPSGASMRAVARAKHQDRGERNSMSPRNSTSPRNSMGPMLSERPRQFPCVVCDAPSYAQKCVACHGYMCPLHGGGEDEWCELCQQAYAAAGIPQIRPVLSMTLGALSGGLLAAAFFGAASAGAQRPMRLMVGPTLILMLLGMLVGVGQRWIRRWWFLRSRPDRASVRPKMVEEVLDAAMQQSPTIVEIVEVGTLPLAPFAEPLAKPEASAPPIRRATYVDNEQRLHNPQIPLAPSVPDVEEAPPPSNIATRLVPGRERHWMSSTPYKTPIPQDAEPAPAGDHTVASAATLLDAPAVGSAAASAESDDMTLGDPADTHVGLAESDALPLGESESAFAATSAVEDDAGALAAPVDAKVGLEPVESSSSQTADVEPIPEQSATAEPDFAATAPSQPAAARSAIAEPSGSPRARNTSSPPAARVSSRAPSSAASAQEQAAPAPRLAPPEQATPSVAPAPQLAPPARATPSVAPAPRLAPPERATPSSMPPRATPSSMPPRGSRRRSQPIPSWVVPSPSSLSMEPSRREDAPTAQSVFAARARDMSERAPAAEPARPARDLAALPVAHSPAPEEQAGALAPDSSVVPIANRSNAGNEPLRSAWSKVLETHGTASGW